MHTWVVSLLMAMSLSLINGTIPIMNSFNSSNSLFDINADYRSAISTSKLSDSSNSKVKRADPLTIATVAIAGATLAGTTAQQITNGLSHSVGGAIEIINLSKYRLTDGEIWTEYGTYKEVVPTIRPGYKEAWTVHKASWGFAGTSGVISYHIKNGAKFARFYIVWQAPYDLNWQDNFLALGLWSHSVGPEQAYEFLTENHNYERLPWLHVDGYQKNCGMVEDFVCGYYAQTYYGGGGSDRSYELSLFPNRRHSKFRKIEEYTWPLVEVTGTMGNGNKFTIKIKIKGRD